MPVRHHPAYFFLAQRADAQGRGAPALRRFGRGHGFHQVMLENHGVARPESQQDYHKRQLEWFAHYLKGEPAADWITNGESYLTRQKLLKEAGAGAAAPTTVVP